jgi:uncharacterized protein
MYDFRADPGSSNPVNEWLAEAGSQIHGQGLFARRTIPRDTQLIEYVGERISKAESLSQCETGNEYVFTLDAQWDIDGNVPWNPARLANHSCAPNCEAVNLEGRIWLFALRDIAAGEEITFNYGYDIEDYREHPCRCGSSACTGFMVAEEFFPMLAVARPRAGAVATAVSAAKVILDTTQVPG